MRHFTPEEANEALSEVRPLVEQMVARRRAHAEALERQEELEERIRGNGGGIPPAVLAGAAAEVEREAAELARLVDEIAEHGAEVKDLDEGLIDFPARRAGETVQPPYFDGGPPNSSSGRRPAKPSSTRCQ